MKEKTPLSVKLEPEVHARLEECAKRTRIKKYALALLAIEAAVDAIEQNGYKLVVPIQFDVAQVPAPQKKIPPHTPSRMELNEPREILPGTQTG